MQVTVEPPYIGQKAIFTFKEPFATYFKLTYNLDSLEFKLKVVSIISMKDMLRNDLRDPYSEVYLKAGIPVEEFNRDLENDIPLIGFSFVDLRGNTQYLRCPLNYIESYRAISSIEYINKLLVIDLNKLPLNLDITFFFDDLKDFIENRIGIRPDIKEVAIGEIELIDNDEHTTRETVRQNSITVYKTLSTQYHELNLKYNELLARLDQLGITLGS